MKPITEPITRAILERALENSVKGLSHFAREKILEREATALLSGEYSGKISNDIIVKLPINEKKEFDTLICKHIISGVYQ